jgi:hypothetical protein
MTQFKSKTILLGLLDNENGRVNDIVIWLVGNYETNEVTFFLDENMDRDYTNDGLPIVLKGGKSGYKAVMIPPDGRRARELWVSVPEKPEIEDFQGAHAKGLKAKIRRQFSAGLHVRLGSGDLSYRFLNTEYGFPTWYNVKSSEKSIGASFSFHTRHLRFGLNATYQNQFFYTSTQRIQTDVPKERILSDGTVQIIESVITNRNRDLNPTSRFQFGSEIGYRIHLNPFMELQPVGGAGIITYQPGYYIPDQRFEGDRYSLTTSPYLEGGIRAEFVTGYFKALVVGFHIQKLWWQPDGYFETFPHENLEVKYVSWRIHFGYRMGL